MSMTQVIEFYSLPHFTPRLKWPPDEQRGKVIPFMAQRKVSDELLYTGYEELNSESSRWPEPDGAPYLGPMEYALPLRLEEEFFLENSSNAIVKSSSVSSKLLFLSDGDPIGHETEVEYLISNASFCSYFVLDARTGLVIGVSNDASVRQLLYPFARTTHPRVTNH